MITFKGVARDWCLGVRLSDLPRKPYHKTEEAPHTETSMHALRAPADPKP